MYRFLIPCIALFTLNCGIGTWIIVDSQYAERGLACISGSGSSEKVLLWIVLGSIILEFGLGVWLLGRMKWKFSIAAAVIHGVLTIVLGPFSMFVLDRPDHCKFDFNLGKVKWKVIHSEYHQLAKDTTDMFIDRLKNECASKHGSLPTKSDFDLILKPVITSPNQPRRYEPLAAFIYFDSVDQKYHIFDGQMRKEVPYLRQEPLIYYCKID